MADTCSRHANEIRSLDQTIFSVLGGPNATCCDEGKVAVEPFSAPFRKSLGSLVQRPFLVDVPTRDMEKIKSPGQADFRRFHSVAQSDAR